MKMILIASLSLLSSVTTAATQNPIKLVDFSLSNISEHPRMLGYFQYDFSFGLKLNGTNTGRGEFRYLINCYNGGYFSGGPFKVIVNGPDEFKYSTTGVSPDNESLSTCDILFTQKELPVNLESDMIKGGKTFEAIDQVLCYMNGKTYNGACYRHK